MKSPLKRTNPEKGRGVDPNWVEISWDEAYQTIGSKLQAILKADPDSFYVQSGHRAGANTLFSTFMSATGTANRMGSVNYCTGGGVHTTSFHLYGAAVTEPETEYHNYNIDSGGRFLGSKATPRLNRFYSQAKDRGLKTIGVCPMITPNSNPDEWLPIKPGTDTAFFLSMINVMVNELGVMDVQFIKKRTNGPYLIGPDGFYVLRTNRKS